MPTPEGDGGDGDADETRLVVADPAARKLYVYGIPSYAKLAELDGVTFADHPGFLPLPDGRVLFADEEAQSLQVLRTSPGTPAIVATVPLAAPPVHLAVDPAFEYAAVSGAAQDGAAAGRFTLVRLSDFTSKTIELPTGEPGVLLGGTPLHLYHRNSAPAQVEAFLFSELWSGTVAARGSAPLGTGPHGEALAHAHGKIAVATDDGIDVMTVTAATFSGQKTIPYEASGRSGGRAFYARLSADGRHLYSYLRNAPPDSTWSTWSNDAYIVDLETETAKRIDLGNGLVYRLADCPKYAMYTQYSPDGDLAHILDTAPASPTFQSVVAKIPLQRLSQAPDSSGDVWASKAFRITGMSPDCAHGFVTHGGDGKVSVIDLEQRRVVHTLDIPTSLDGGGYVLGVRRGFASADTIGR